MYQPSIGVGRTAVIFYREIEVVDALALGHTMHTLAFSQNIFYNCRRTFIVERKNETIAFSGICNGERLCYTFE